jgi:four helix bundle protein
MQDFRKLKVWHKAHAHTLDVHEITKRFPRSGYGPLKLQLTRAAESIPFNMVEGCGASTQKEFGRYLDISIKSTTETEYQLLLGFDYGVIPEKDWSPLAERTIVIRKMLCRLRKKVVGEEDPDTDES